MAQEKQNGPSWLYQDQDYKAKNLVFPSDDVDPEIKKEKGWCTSWAKAIYSKMLNNQAFVSIDRMAKMETNRLYALGSQPRYKYQDMLIGDVNENPGREGYYNIDWSIFSPMPAYIRKVIGRLESSDHKLSVNAVDPLSGTEREDMMWDSYYELKHGLQEQAIKMNAGIEEDNNETKYVPSSMEELEAFNQVGGFKLKHEIDMEKALNYTDYVSDIKEIRRKCEFDFIAINCAAYRDFVELDGTVKYEYLDFARLVIDGNRENGFKSSRFWGYMRFETITNIRAKTRLPEAELIKFCTKYQNWFGNPVFIWEQDIQNSLSVLDPVTGTYKYDNYLIPILDCEMKSVDTEYKTTRTTKHGTKVYAKEKYGEVKDSATKKTTKVAIPQIYRCKWIIGSDISYDYGLQYDIPRVGTNKVPEFSCHAYALPGKSMTEQCIGPLDQIELAYLKMQNAMAQATPNGLAIEFGSLNNINLGNGDLKPLDLIKIRTATGNLVYKATTHAGKYNAFQGKPIEKIEGGIGSLFNEIIQTFELNFNFIAELSGIDRLSAVASKGGETTATEITQTVASASDAIQPIYSGWLNIRESGARNALEKIRLQIKYRNGYNVYYPVLGSATIENFRISKEYASRTYGLKVEAIPTSNFMQVMLQAASEALKPGKDGENISYGDYLLIVDMIFKGMLKQARMLLNYRLEIRKQQAIKVQQENIALQGKEGQKMEQEKRLSAAEALKGEMMLEAVKAFLKREVDASTEQGKLQSELIKTLVMPVANPQQSAPAA